VEKEIMHLNRIKCPGADGITGEIIKGGGKGLAR